ncbi:methyltransferase family protein [Marivita hallyeonensis]|uniref:Protein-S-isoprenylcysteine O-methyltransferase Ste14 n=1 Tax=Marivita hallyeonensis TaxID=996342 RepID=A0A1M5MQ92_9RHOB|nr:isoprenylcysteine carboxylmethyltransferase family protein [Marivita hallyeonensis]SHG79554.1 Protein-S-isoprenylcysteine O-methyltransferase Ste14 [Marivita hallyeonensis]
MIDYVAGFVALAYFLLISAATKQHFVSDKYPMGMYIISSLSLFGIFTFLLHAFLWDLRFTGAPLVIMFLAFALFIWAAKHSKKKLSLAFDEKRDTDGIITTGPWRYMRHPFYVSYVIFWLACALGTAHPTSLVVFATLLFIYGYSAVREEGALKRGRYADEYLKYQQSVGFVLPKLYGRN